MTATCIPAFTNRRGPGGGLQCPIDLHQYGRRETTPEQQRELLARVYNRRKKKHGGDRKSEESKAQNGTLKPTADAVAQDFGVSKNTVKRAAADYDLLEKQPEGIRNHEPETTRICRRLLPVPQRHRSGAAVVSGRGVGGSNRYSLRFNNHTATVRKIFEVDLQGVLPPERINHEKR